MSAPTTPLAAWRRSFRRHDPLTLRVPRTTAEIDDDPLAWWEGPDGTQDERPSSFDRLCWAVAVLFMAVLAYAAMRIPG